MNFDEIKTIDDLAICMDADAKKYNREHLLPITVTGRGIRKQFSQIRNDTHNVYYLRGYEKSYTLYGAEFILKIAVFDRAGNIIKESG